MDIKYKLLIVEDDESLRLLLSEYFTMEGFEVLKASNGEEGWKIVRNNLDLDMVLLDLLLPSKMDGLDVLEKIKGNPETRNIPVYLSTVLERDEVIKKAFDIGASGYIIKDVFTPEQIKEELLKFLSANQFNTQ